MSPSNADLFELLLIDGKSSNYKSAASNWIQHPTTLFNLLQKEKVFFTFCDKCLRNDVELPKSYNEEYQRLLKLRSSYDEARQLAKEVHDQKNFMLVKGLFYEDIYPAGLKREWHDIDFFFSDFKSFEPFLIKLIENNYVFSKRSGTYWYKDLKNSPIVSMFLHHANENDPDHQVECQVGYFPLTWLTGIPYNEIVNPEGEIENVKHHFFFWASRKTKELSTLGVRDLLDLCALKDNFPLKEHAVKDLKRLLLEYGILDSTKLFLIDSIFKKAPTEWSVLLEAELGLENSRNAWHFKQWGKKFSRSSYMLLWGEKLKIAIERKSHQSKSWYAMMEPFATRIFYHLKVPLYIKPCHIKNSYLYPVIELSSFQVRLGLFER